MSEKPEQMLVEQDITAVRGIEELGVDRTVHQEHGADDHDGWHREDDHDCDDQLLPKDDGHAVQRHPWRAEAKYRAGDADRYAQGRNFRERNHLRPEIRALAGSE